MECPKCGSNNVYVTMNTSAKVTGPNLGQRAGRAIMNMSTLGIYGAIAGKQKGNLKTKPIALCQNCGKKFNV